MSKKLSEIKVKISVDSTDLDEALNKIKELNDLLTALGNIVIPCSVQIDRKETNIDHIKNKSKHGR